MLAENVTFTTAKWSTVTRKCLKRWYKPCSCVVIMQTNTSRGRFGVLAGRWDSGPLAVTSRVLALSMLKTFAHQLLRERDVGLKLQLNSHRSEIHQGLLGQVVKTAFLTFFLCVFFKLSVPSTWELPPVSPSSSRRGTWTLTSSHLLPSDWLVSDTPLSK